MCFEVTRDQSVIRDGEEAGEFEGVVELARIGWRDIDVDDLVLHSIYINHDSLVLQTGIVGEQVAQAELPVGELLVN